MSDFKKELEQFKQMIKDNLPKIELDNELSRLKEKYGLGQRLNERGHKAMKKILDKYWTGTRLDDQELKFAYFLLPKIILYEKVSFRVLDMVSEIEGECKHRWGVEIPPLTNNQALQSMMESNPDFEKNATQALDKVRPLWVEK